MRIALRSIQRVGAITTQSSINPRRKKEVTKDLPRVMERITPYGVVICKGGYEMDYKGMRYENEKFIRNVENHVLWAWSET